MYIRDRKKYMIVLLLLAVLFASTSCRREDNPVKEPDHSGIPISLTASTEWPELTKGLYESDADLVGDGFVVWADLKSYDASTNSNAYYNIFGENGTKVYHDNPESPGDPLWNYSPEQYWLAGTYYFAAVLPASLFDATYKNESDKNKSSFTGTYYADLNVFSLDFGDGGFNLSTDQTDLMIAFAESTYDASQMSPEAEEPDPVTLQFYHQLALLNFSIVNAIGSESTITVNSVELYGNYAAADSLTPDDGWLYDTDSKTDSETPFYAYTWDNDNNPVSTSETETAALIQDLLVFPEAPEEGEEPSKVIIKVNFTETLSSSENTTTRDAQIPMNWVAGQTYTYECRITPSSLVVIQKSDTEWTEIKDITHTFN